MTTSFSRPDPFAAEYAELDPIHQPDGTTQPSPNGYAETLEEMGQRLLVKVNEAALHKGVTLPNRQLVYPAPIPADCEQVAVLFTQFTPTPIQDAGSTVMCKTWRWIAPFSVIITRCTPAMPGKGRGIKMVDPKQMMAAAKIASDDAEILVNVITRLGEIGPDATVVTNAPSGGFQTVELNVPLISGGSL